MINYSTICTTFPGLCAIDFQNIIAMTLKYFIGWNFKDCVNDPEFGLFGDIDAWSYCVEEQGK